MAKKKSSKKKARAPTPDDIGATVFVEGLQSQPELNGSRGTIIAFNREKNRYTVECGATTKKISVKPENLRVAGQVVERSILNDGDGAPVAAAAEGKLDPRTLSPWAMPSARVNTFQNTNDHPLTKAWIDAMPVSSKMAMMQVACGVPGRSVEALPAASQWCYTVSHLFMNFITHGHREFIVTTKDPGPSTEVVGVQLVGDARAAPAGFAGVDAGAPLYAVRVWLGGHHAVMRKMVDRTPRPELSPDYIYAESRAQIASGSMALRALSERVAGVDARAPGAARASSASFASVLAPPNDLATPMQPKQREICSACGDARDEGRPKFMMCARCRGASYCSKACQKAHWSAHKKVCGVAATSDRESVVVSTIAPPELQGLWTAAPFSFTGELGANASAGHQIKDSAPRNVHGDAVFVVKIQLPMDGVGTMAMIYDRSRSFTLQMVPLPPNAAAYVRATREFQGNKAYLEAKREGENLRIFIDKRAPTPPW